jgi:Zn finger protein HypA/HybF involved in hydrogenase expression
MAKIEVTCSCGQIFIMKENEVKLCPKCNKPHRGPVAPTEFQVTFN